LDVSGEALYDNPSGSDALSRLEMLLIYLEMGQRVVEI
jgi:hypothetical protein